MNHDQIAGKWDQLVGSAKQHWGSLTDDDVLRAEGSAEKLYGIIQARFGDAREAIEEKLTVVKKKLRGPSDGQLERVNFADHSGAGLASPGQRRPEQSSSGPLDHRIDPRKAEAVAVGSDPTAVDGASKTPRADAAGTAKSPKTGKGASKARAATSKSK